MSRAMSGNTVTDETEGRQDQGAEATLCCNDSDVKW